MKAGWKTVELASVCNVFTDGNWIETKDQAESGIRLVQTGNVGQGVFKDRGDKARYIDEATFLRLRCFEIMPGDCLISRLPDPVGRACRIPETGEKMITAVDCTVLRADQTKLDTDFFIYFSQSSRYLSDVETRCSGTTRSRISRSNLGATIIPLPPLDEQKRIVAVLDAAFEGLSRARAHAQANLENLSNLRKSTLAKVFAGQRIFANDTAAKTGWQVKALGEVCTLQRGYDLPTSQRTAGVYPLVTSSGATDTHNEYKVKGPGVVTGRSGSIGNVFFIEDDFWPLNTALYVKDFHGNDERFIWYLLRNFDLSRFSSGTGVPTLNRNDVHSELINVLASIEEQRKIVITLDEAFDAFAATESHYRAKLADLDALRQALLQKAFAGDLT